MPTTPTKGTTVSFSNTPQANNDVYHFGESIEGSVQTLDVMANDLGGAAKSLYSIDDGINSGGATGDLLAQDAIGAISFSQLGAKISITSAGKIAYDTSTLGDLDHLAAGAHLTDIFTYAIKLGNGTLSWATVTIDIVGSNDAPVVSGPVTGNATEDGSSVTLNALAN